MKKISTHRFVFLAPLYFLFTISLCVAQSKSFTGETPFQKTKRMQWWADARFGMFIHWGLYSLPARHEWVRNFEHISNEDYQKYFNMFNPDLFDPKKWAKEAKAAGMKYVVLTTKHHEGFCLFDSKFTDYKATNTAAKRDLVKEYAAAFRDEGIKVGFYYSLIDWHHPDFLIDEMHPLRPSDSIDAATFKKINAGKDMSRYRAYLKNQVKELMSNYGKIDILWLDFSYPGLKSGHGKGHNDWASADLLKMVRQLQPGIIVNNRLDLDDYSDGYDFETPEQVSPKELEKYRGKTWETCQTFSGSWGYHRDENTWKTHRQLLDLLITSTANGGNLILNVGPTARGEFDYRANYSLDSLAMWMHANSKSIYSCTYAPETYSVPVNDRLTYNASAHRLYLHLFNYPAEGKLRLTGYAGKIKYVQFLHDNSELRFNTEGNDIIVQLPEKKPIYEVPVIEMVL
jgi:alpha-L-fucosidase